MPRGEHSDPFPFSVTYLPENNRMPESDNAFEIRIQLLLPKTVRTIKWLVQGHPFTQ